jgi:aryl-alcohol dehydrogenase-like predicted oxidoreductase
MEYRALGRTGLQVSVLGFGCGNVGGLMVRGTPAEQERAVARALELGVNYFDTAPLYGDGQSETNLGRTLRALRARPHVGTKFRLASGDLRDVPAAVTRALDESLTRLGMESVDLFQCHNSLMASGPDTVTSQRLLEAIVPALEKLRQQGKLRFYGITALGDTDALHRVVDAGTIHTAQVCLNLLNPSAAFDTPAAAGAQDFRKVAVRARERSIGVIVIRVLAAGALSGVASRHPIAVPDVAPIATGPDYAADVARARALQPLVDDGYARSLVEASLRLPLAAEAVSTVLLGYSSLEHLETAAAAIAKGPLPTEALALVAKLGR